MYKLKTFLSVFVISATFIGFMSNPANAGNGTITCTDVNSHKVVGTKKITCNDKGVVNPASIGFKKLFQVCGIYFPKCSAHGQMAQPCYSRIQCD